MILFTQNSKTNLERQKADQQLSGDASGGKDGVEGAGGNLRGGNGDLYDLKFTVMVSQMYIYVKPHQMEHFQHVYMLVIHH